MPSMNIPAELTRGAHDHPRDGACVMEIASLLAKEDWSDMPACTNEVVARHAQYVNDVLGHEARQRLWTFLPRIMRARRTDADRRINTRLAIWAARRVEHLIREQDQEVAKAALDAAEAWLADPSEENESAASYAASAAYAASSAAASASASASASAASASASASAAYAVAAASASASAYAVARDQMLLEFLDQLLDQWELAAKAEDQDIYVPREWEDEALAFCAEMIQTAEAQ